MSPEFARPPQVAPATTAEARELIEQAGLAAPADFDLYSKDGDLAAIMNERGLDPLDSADVVVLRGLGFGENFRWMKALRTTGTPSRGLCCRDGVMSPLAQYLIAGQAPGTQTRPYNT